MCKRSMDFQQNYRHLVDGNANLMGYRNGDEAYLRQNFGKNKRKFLFQLEKKEIRKSNSQTNTIDEPKTLVL